MSPLEKQAFGLIILGGIVVLGIYWQYKLCQKDTNEFKSYRRKYPSRIKWGAFLCGLLIAGIIVNGLIGIYIDDRRPYSGAQIWMQVRTTILFSFIFLIKSYFGPILTMGALAIAAYYYLNYGMLTNLPIVSAVMDFTASLAPDWLENIYTVVYSGYAVVTSLKDTFDT